MKPPRFFAPGKVLPPPEMPSPEEFDVAFEAYALAVGKVANAWNLLHEELGEIFVRIIGGDPKVTTAVWYSTYSDRSQRLMLEAAVKAATGDHPAWERLPIQARDDLLYLLKRSNELGDKRDEAIHAPCFLLSDHRGQHEMAASLSSEHRRAKSLRGKQLLVEFDWCERYALDLYRFALDATLTMDGLYKSTWPERPRAPDRKPKKALQDPRPQPLPK